MIRQVFMTFEQRNDRSQQQCRQLESSFFKLQFGMFLDLATSILQNICYSERRYCSIFEQAYNGNFKLKRPFFVNKMELFIDV